MEKETLKQKIETSNEAVLERIQQKDGMVLELYVNPKNNRVSRYYIKNKDDVIEFGDPERYEKMSNDIVKLVKHQLAEDHILVDDEEAEKIARAINEREFSKGFDANEDFEN